MNGALVNVYGCHLGPPADRMVLSAISLSGIVKKKSREIRGTPSSTPPHSDLNLNVRSNIHPQTSFIHSAALFVITLRSRDIFGPPGPLARCLSMSLTFGFGLWRSLKNLACARRLRRTSQRLLQCPDARIWSTRFVIGSCTICMSAFIAAGVGGWWRAKKERCRPLTHNSIIIQRRHSVTGKLNVS